MLIHHYYFLVFRSGKDRAEEAANAAISAPLIERQLQQATVIITLTLTKKNNDNNDNNDNDINS